MGTKEVISQEEFDRRNRTANQERLDIYNRMADEKYEKDLKEYEENVGRAKMASDYFGHVLKGFRLHQIQDVTPEIMRGKVTYCQANIEIEPDIPSDPRWDDRRAELDQNFAPLAMMAASKTIAYQVSRDVETGKPIVRITSGLD